MANFETDAEIEQWISEHSWLEFEQNIDFKRFGERRLQNADAYRNRRREEAAARSAERQTEATERSASSAEEQTALNRRAIVISIWALGTSIASLVIALLTFAFKK